MIPLSQQMPPGYHAVSKRAENRRQNLRRLIEEYDGPKALAEKLGYTNSSSLVQMAGPNPTREVTEKTARKLEQTLGLEEGSLDWTPKPSSEKHHASGRGQAVAKSAPVSADTTSTMDVIQLVAQVCEQKNFNLPPVKFSNVVAFVLAEQSDGVKIDAERIARLLDLVSK